MSTKTKKPVMSLSESIARQTPDKHKVFKTERVKHDLSKPEGVAALQQAFYDMSVAGKLKKTREQMERILQDHGLPTTDPKRLMFRKPSAEQRMELIKKGLSAEALDGNLADENWPENIKLCAQALFRLQLIEECLHSGHAENAVFNTMLMMGALNQLDFNQFEVLIWLGLQKQKAANRGAKNSANERKQIAQAEAETICTHARALLKDGTAPHHLSAKLAARHGKTPRWIREILKRNHVL